AHGTVTLNANGSFSYRPTGNYNGPDSFTYKANDGSADSNVATVALTVNPVNDAPTCASATLTTAEDTPGATDPTCTDVDGNSLTYAIVAQPAHGTASVGADNKLHYIPASNYNGPDSFTYKANDGTLDSNVGTVSVTVNAVNDVPVAANDAYTTAAGAPLTVPAPGVLGNDSDVDGDTLSAGSASTPTHGSVALNPNGSFTYTPAAGYSGGDAFTYVASDGHGGTAPATVAMTVTPPPPPSAGPTTFSVNDLSLPEGNSGTSPATFTIARSGDTSGPASVKYRTSGGTATAGTDYTAVPLLTLNFGPGESAKAVTVNVAGDGAPEANETFNLVLSAPTGAVLADTSGTATIVNDDGSAYVAVDNVTVTEGNSATTAATFTISRSGNTSASSTVTYRTSGGTAAAGSDYTAVALTAVTFGPGQTTKSVTVDVAGDTTDEANETFNLVLSAPVGAVLSDASGAATIVDDDGAITPGPKT
ncbi:MAG: tandem-95 repeat protein, partial [Actinobacteria bacterium]|nr:tandem-95 repeat protein [Actinomycetota bacterium]